MDYPKSDARIVIDDLLRKAGWGPADKSMVETEVRPRASDRRADPEGDPAQLIRETLALEREIVTGLEKLLKEIEG